MTASTTPLRISSTLSRAVGASVAFGALTLAACQSPPREADVQYVARDVWDPVCAAQAIVEQWSQKDGTWKVQGEVFQVTVGATFKLVNACTGKDGREYKQFETVRFEQSVELSPCKKDGKSGWAVPGMQETRCWTGPTPLAR